MLCFQLCSYFGRVFSGDDGKYHIKHDSLINHGNWKDHEMISS